MHTSTQSNPIEKIELQAKGVAVFWHDGTHHVFHPLWLRESSTHPEYRDLGTQMRMPPAYELPLDISLTMANVTENGGLTVSFSDGHSCTFAGDHLYKSVHKRRPDDLVGQHSYWDSTFSDFRKFSYTAMQNDEKTVLAAIQSVAQFGFAYVEGLPLELDELDRFARLVGPPRETNWGTITDVRNMPNPYDLTVTSKLLWPHVDNPYRLPAPGYIFMHCIRNDADGGESTIVDGFGAAMALKEIDPEAFEALTTIAPNFHHAEENAILEDYGPMIQVDETGEVRRIRFSNRTEQVPTLDHDTLDRYYRARQLFSELIFSEQLTLITKLKPEDGFIWDNYRILHGRTAFDITTGDRHMRHCYVDRDSMSSRHKCLLQSLDA